MKDHLTAHRALPRLPGHVDLQSHLLRRRSAIRPVEQSDEYYDGGIRAHSTPKNE